MRHRYHNLGDRAYSIPDHRPPPCGADLDDDQQAGAEQAEAQNDSALPALTFRTLDDLLSAVVSTSHSPTIRDALIVLLYYRHNLPRSDISAILGCSSGYVFDSLTRARLWMASQKFTVVDLAEQTTAKSEERE